MTPPISVILCAHNPRRDYLGRVLDALKAQRFDPSRWELLVIDNASEPPLAGDVDLSWHPAGRILREDQAGLTPARLRGIAGAQGELLVFVDDDNVLDPGYLEAGEILARKYPFLGVWGGQIRGEFEIPPPAWTQIYWPMLAIREFAASRWSNFSVEFSPCGAGLWVRAGVARHYAGLAQKEKPRQMLGRTGRNLSSAEDTDIVYTAYDLGMGSGLFAELKLVHLIPAFRLSEDYLLRLREELEFSHTVLRGLRQIDTGTPQPMNWIEWCKARLRAMNIRHPRVRRFERAQKRGQARGVQFLQDLDNLRHR